MVQCPCPSISDYFSLFSFPVIIIVIDISSYPSAVRCLLPFFDNFDKQKPAALQLVFSLTLSFTATHHVQGRDSKRVALKIKSERAGQAN